MAKDEKELCKLYKIYEAKIRNLNKNQNDLARKINELEQKGTIEKSQFKGENNYTVAEDYH